MDVGIHQVWNKSHLNVHLIFDLPASQQENCSWYDP